MYVRHRGDFSEEDVVIHIAPNEFYALLDEIEDCRDNRVELAIVDTPLIDQLLMEGRT